MRTRFTYYFLLASISLLYYSCGKESSCFKGSGSEITELRSITAEVTKIVLEDNIDLYIIQDSVVSLKLEGGENLLPYINTDVSGNVLEINSDNKCGFFRDYNMPLTAYLTLPNIEQIELLGQGDVANSETLTYSNLEIDARAATGSVNLTLNADNLAVRQHSGVADFTINGAASNAYFYTLGNGWMFCNGLVAKDVHVNHSGSGDVFVHASNSLLVELTGTGNLHYYGNPNVTVSVQSGSGKLIKK